VSPDHPRYPKLVIFIASQFEGTQEYQKPTNQDHTLKYCLYPLNIEMQGASTSIQCPMQELKLATLN